MRVLGISPFHDSSVAVYCDRKIEFFCKEERLSRVKRDKHPFLSLDLAIEKIGISNIDLAVICSPTNTDPSINTYSNILKKHYNFLDVVDLSAEHHLQHAALAFYNSGFSESIVIVADRNGSYAGFNARESETVYIASYPDVFLPIYKNYWMDDTTKKEESISDITELFNNNADKISIHCNSSQGIVKVYESATTLIKQHLLENGKTMGLAAYGEDTKDFPKFFEEFGVGKDELFFHKYNSEMDYACYGSLVKHLLDTEMTRYNYKQFANYAYQVQKQTQEAMLSLVDAAVKSTGIKKVCITGGYGLNVVANNFYVKNMPDVDFYFEPIADDSGNSLGGAMYMYRTITKDPEISKMETLFFNSMSSSNLTNLSIESSLLNKDLDSLGRQCTVEEVASMLMDKKSVAIFNLLAEAGPRALGNRSILFDARHENAKDLVNKIKKREWYRPFAAAVLEEDAHLYFNMILKESPYMTVSFDVLQDAKDIIPGVTHVDGTCRVQTVSQETGPIYTLLKKVKELSGHGILLNTSFNLAGQPLVNTVQEAIDVLDSSELDAIWFPEVDRIVESSR